MKKLSIVYLLPTLLLLGCDAFKGTLKAERQLTLKDKKGNALTVPAGSYEAKVSAGSKVKLTVAVGSQKVEATFIVPSGQKIRSFDDVNLAASVTGQLYDIRGQERTSSQDGSPVHEEEGCSISQTERQCGNVTTPRECRNEADAAGITHEVCTGGGTQYVCRDVTVSIPGTRIVEYYETDWVTNRYLQLFEPGTQQRVAVFHNETSGSSRNYTFEGSCHRDIFARD